MNAARLCEALGIELKVEHPRKSYHHGWGQGCADYKPIMRTWTILTMDVNDRPTSLCFDLVDGVSPLLVGLDIKRYADTVNTEEPTVLLIKRPTDGEYRVFYKNIA